MASAALGDLLQTRWHVGVRDVRRCVTSAGLIANSALMLALAAATGVRGAAGAALSIALFCAAFAVLGVSIGGGYQVRVISDCHFSVQLNYFIPGFLSYSVPVFVK